MGSICWAALEKFSDAKISKRLVIIGWCSRYVHVIADTGIIFGAFYALEKKQGQEEVRGKGAYRRRHNLRTVYFERGSFLVFFRSRQFIFVWVLV